MRGAAAARRGPSQAAGRTLPLRRAPGKAATGPARNNPIRFLRPGSIAAKRLGAAFRGRTGKDSRSVRCQWKTFSFAADTRTRVSSRLQWGFSTGTAAVRPRLTFAIDIPSSIRLIAPTGRKCLAAGRTVILPTPPLHAYFNLLKYLLYGEEGAAEWHSRRQEVPGAVHQQPAVRCDRNSLRCCARNSNVLCMQQ